MKKPFVIGIAGGSASGKSTFADALEQAFAAEKLTILHMDDYFKPKEQRPLSKALVTRKEYVDDNHPQTMDLPKLGKDLAHTIAVGECSIVIVEGLLTLWDDCILDMLDLKLFVDCRAEERIVRRLKRNMQWGLTFDQISDVYLDLVRYRHDEYVENTKWRADMIVNGAGETNVAVEAVVAYAERVISNR